jgi:PII-like signaling protein
MLQAQIYFDKDELQGMQPLYEYILHFLIKEKIQGATVFRGRLGYGENQKLNRPNDLFSFDETPMMITFIDEDEKIRAVLTALRKEMIHGFIITNQVEKWQ